MVTRGFKPHFKILDVGSGEGNLFKCLPRCQKYGIDISSVYCKKAKERNLGAIIIKANAEKIPFKDETFDFVFCTELLEHILNPQKAVLEIARVIKKNGIAVFSTYNHHNLGNLITLRALTSKYVSEDHLREYTYSTFQKLIKENGNFNILEFKCVGYGRIIKKIASKLKLITAIDKLNFLPIFNFLIFKCIKS